MKIYQSKVLNNLAMFDKQRLNDKIVINPVSGGLMRGLTDMFLIWKTIEYFQPSKLLEIGSYAGQTLGLMLESAGPDSNITSIDISFNKFKIFDHLFPDSQVQRIQLDSLQFHAVDTFDFMHIDGHHDYEHALNDITKCLSMAHDDSIIVIDDYEKSNLGVGTAIETGILEQHDFVPFLLGDSNIFFHHCTHQSGDFLDRWIQERARNFIHFSNINFGKHLVLRPHFISQCTLTSTMPGIFQRNLDFLLEATKFYDL
jgi:predicted O-methyltransferase YrrM